MSCQNPTPDDPDILESDKWQRRVDLALEKRGAPNKRLETPIFLLYRFTIRLLRITIGGIVCISVIKGLNKSWEILSKPFASLTSLEIFAGLGLGVMCLLGFGLALLFAFGQGETRGEYEIRLVTKRKREIENELFTQDKSTIKRNEEVKNIYKAGYAFGIFIRHLLTLFKLKRSK